MEARGFRPGDPIWLLLEGSDEPGRAFYLWHDAAGLFVTAVLQGPFKDFYPWHRVRQFFDRDEQISVEE